MFKTRVKLNEQISNLFQQDIESKLLYLSDKILDYRIISGSQYIDEIEFTCTEEFDVENYLNMLILKDYIHSSYIDEQTVWVSDCKESHSFDIFNELAKQNMITYKDDGRIAIGEPLIGSVKKSL